MKGVLESTLGLYYTWLGLWYRLRVLHNRSVRCIEMGFFFPFPCSTVGYNPFGHGGVRAKGITG